MTEEQSTMLLEKWCKRSCKEICSKKMPCDNCVVTFIKQTLDINNRQKAEIERLEDKLKDKSAEIRALIASIDRLMKVNKQEVIEHLKKINFNAFPKEILNAIKSEGRKEFAERLKAQADGYDLCQDGFIYEMVDVDDIDNLVKEMTEENPDE